MSNAMYACHSPTSSLQHHPVSTSFKSQPSYRIIYSPSNRSFSPSSCDNSSVEDGSDGLPASLQRYRLPPLPNFEKLSPPRYPGRLDDSFPSGRSARGRGNSTRTTGKIPTRGSNELPSLRSVVARLSMPYGRPPNRVGTTGYMDYSPCPEQRSDACSDVDRRSAHWLHFTRKIKDAENHTKYKCLWQQDVGVICTYVAKRQLVKRHIEDRHMGLRPFICSYCDQAFAQRSNMNTHINTKHTGEQPHVCPEPDCPKKFGDPARLLRHRTDAHGYIPKRSSKKQRPLPVQSKDAQSRYETEYPWRLVAGTSASYGSVN